MKTTAPAISRTSSTGNPPAKAVKRQILLVDDHPVMREGFAQLINHEPDLHVCAQAATPDAALESLAHHKPHLAVVDLSLGDASGLSLVRELLRRHPALPILILSMHDESVYAERALRSGARGFVMKQAPTDEVMAAIRAVLAGGTHLSDRVKTLMITTMVSGKKPAAPVETLSDRELEVFELIGKGRTTREIAEGLGLSIKTVETYRMHIKEKLVARTGAELGRRATEWNGRQKSGSS